MGQDEARQAETSHGYVGWAQRACERRPTVAMTNDEIRMTKEARMTKLE